MASPRRFKEDSGLQVTPDRAHRGAWYGGITGTQRIGSRQAEARALSNSIWAATGERPQGGRQPLGEEEKAGSPETPKRDRRPDTTGGPIEAITPMRTGDPQAPHAVAMASQFLDALGSELQLNGPRWPEEMDAFRVALEFTRTRARLLENDMFYASTGMVQHLGVRDVALLAPFVGKMARHIASNVGDEAGWALLMAYPRLFLRAPGEGETMEELLRARITRYEEGDVAGLWDAHDYESNLPTVKDWMKRQAQPEAAKRAATAEVVKRAIRSNNLRAAVRAVDDTPGAPPGEKQHEQLMTLLIPGGTKSPKTTMQRLYVERGYDQPMQSRAETFYRNLQANKEWRKTLVERWAPRLTTARTKKAAGNSGLRTEHLKPFYENDMLHWSIVAEAIEKHVIPPGVQRFFATVLTLQLLKRDETGRYTLMSATRPIGKCERIIADAMVAGSSHAARKIGPYLRRYGQWAVGVPSGGEAVSTAIQLRLTAKPNTLTLFCDCSNAFCRVDNDLTAEACIELIEEVLASGVPEALEIVVAINYALDDLVFSRTWNGEAASVVDGTLRVTPIPGGEVQGGLMAMLRFVIYLCMKVFKPLRRDFEEVAPLNIADDSTAQITVDTPEALNRILAYVIRYDELMTLANQKNNMKKFKILQRPGMPTELDVSSLISRFPKDREGKGPTLVHTACKVNGVGVGFCAETRSEMAMEDVKVLADRALVLQALLPILGPQETEILGRSSYRGGSVLVHLARNVEPSISMPAMHKSVESQVELLRHIVQGSEEHLPQGQFNFATEPHSDRCVPESCHLSHARGGIGWTNMTLLASICSAGRVIDVLQHLRSMPGVAEHVPHPRLWKTSGIPFLIQAMETIEQVAGLPSFAKGPPTHQELWRYVRDRLCPKGVFDPEGVELLAGRHFQHVATGASMQQTHENLVTDDRLPLPTRARLRSCARWGSGAAFAVTHITPDTELTPKQFILGLGRRMGLPVGAVSIETRCMGPQCIYNRANLPTIPGPIGKIQRMLPLREHEDAVHWDGCAAEGVLTAGHNTVNAIFASALRSFGWQVTVGEIRLGEGPPPKNKPGERGKPQRADGVARNWLAGCGKPLAFDTVIGTTLNHKKLRAAATTSDQTVTAALEKEKKRTKGYACDRRHWDFVAVAMDSYAALGEDAAKILHTGYAARSDAAKTDAEKWAVAHEKQRVITLLSVAVHRRNADAFLANASPLKGHAPGHDPRDTLHPGNEDVGPPLND